MQRSAKCSLRLYKRPRGLVQLGMRKTLICAGAVLLWFAALGSAAGVDDGFVLRVYYDQPADIERLACYDLHEYNNRAEHYVRISANPSIRARLEKEGWRVAVDEQASASARTPAKFTFLGGYRTVNELYRDMAAVTAAYPDITEIVDYGDSYCKTIGGDTHGTNFLAGFNLLAVRVTNRRSAGPKPVFLLMADIHAREITTPEIAMRFLNHLTQGYVSNADARWIVDYQETWILPTSNPDGHWIAELGPYSQRKNGHRAGSTYWPPTESSQYGVDCNRNHSYMWNQGGSSANALDQTYHGVSAASEPEVSGLQTLIRSLIPDQRGAGVTDAAPESATGILVSLHSYSDLVLWPWGYTTVAPPNSSGLAAIGTKFASYNGYTAGQVSITLYGASGDSTDWAYGELGIPAYTFEIGNDSEGFMPAYSVVDAKQWPTNKPALMYAAKLARTPYLTAKGPDALNVMLAPTPSNVVMLSAVINDVNNGYQTIAGAEFAIGTPFWATGAVTYAMAAQDGSFNSVTEAVVAAIDAAQLTNDTPLIFVRGRDSQGNWGAVSAVFVDVIPEPGVWLALLAAAWAGSGRGQRAEGRGQQRRLKIEN